ncbi:hypothetical protein AAFF_G00266010 [Aldrovandia affinis]|uniref:Uncharacterized protein n=1 Tax=Aldrovandia affinis TaxID=143900 RepID=A0AAD7RBN5_9TELE|nr:hypothetical protein AAFF_G00266010 [Aldrovandia affinis]
MPATSDGFSQTVVDERPGKGPVFSALNGRGPLCPTAVAGPFQTEQRERERGALKGPYGNGVPWPRRFVPHTPDCSSMLPGTIRLGPAHVRTRALYADKPVNEG